LFSAVLDSGPCVPEIVTAFLADSRAPVDTACLDRIQPIDFE